MATYEELLLLAKKQTKVYTRAPSKEQRNVRSINLFYIEKVGKRKVYLRWPYLPKGKLVSYWHKDVYTNADWDRAIEEWDKEEMWRILKR